MKNQREILHLDDDPQITLLVAEHFAQRGFRVTPFHDPCEFLARLPGRPERVVILDIDMPQINGLEVLRRVKAIDGGIQVIMLTGMVSLHSVLESLRHGAEACFFKPLINVQPLVDAVTCSFRKLERWWQALDELTRRRKAEAAEIAEALAVLAGQSDYCRAMTPGPSLATAGART